MFAKYLLLHFTTHFGNEPVCAINTLRAFGVSEAEDLEEQLTALQRSNHAMNVKEPSASAANANTDSSGSQHSSGGILPRVGEVPEIADEQSATGTRSEHTSGESARTNVPEEEQKHIMLAHVQAAASDRAFQDRVEPIGSDGSQRVQNLGDRGATQTARPSQASSAEPRFEADPGTSLDPTDPDVFADEIPRRDSSPLSNLSGKGQASHPAKGHPGKGKTAPQVLPHVFNEAVGVIMHEGGSTAGLPAQRSGHSGDQAREGLAKHRQSAGTKAEGQGDIYAGVKMKAEGYARISSNGLPKVSLGKAGSVSVEKLTSPKQVSQSKKCAGSPSDGTGSNPEPDLKTSGPATGSHDDTGHNLAERHGIGSTVLRQKYAGVVKEASPGVGEDQTGSETQQARNDAGRATGKGTKEPAVVPQHDTSAASKGSMKPAHVIVFVLMAPLLHDPTCTLRTAGTSSVYDLIKKELLALKVETSTLGMLMKQAAPQSALQEVVRKHAQTEAKLVLAADTIRALELRLNALEIVHEQAAATHKLHLRVRLHAKIFWGLDLVEAVCAVLEWGTGTM